MHLLLLAAATAGIAGAVPVNNTDVSAVTSTQGLVSVELQALPPRRIDDVVRQSYTDILHFTSAAYCYTNTTLSWTCGVDCEGASPKFRPLATGGAAGVNNTWFVGWDPRFLSKTGTNDGKGSIIVSYAGANSQGDADRLVQLSQDPLPQAFFPGINQRAMVHRGFLQTYLDSAASVLAAVNTARTRYGATNIVTTGHSLGAAVSLIAAASLNAQFKANGRPITVSNIGAGSPRVGNTAWADYVESTLPFIRHVNNKRDFTPRVPFQRTFNPFFYEYINVSGELHIHDNGTWIDCPGRDNGNILCSVGATTYNLPDSYHDHIGPYNGIYMGNQCKPLAPNSRKIPGVIITA